MISGILLFGGIGWSLGHLLGARWLLPVGLLLGGVASFALIYIRYVDVPLTPLGHGGSAGPQDRKEPG